MSAEAFDWFVLLTGWFVLLAVGGLIGAIVESYLERRRERDPHVPNPNWRARVTRRWNVPE